MFLRIELGLIGRQAVQADIFRHDQRFGDVRTVTIHDHDDEAFGMGRADLSQEDAHVPGSMAGRIIQSSSPSSGLTAP